MERSAQIASSAQQHQILAGVPVGSVPTILARVPEVPRVDAVPFDTALWSKLEQIQFDLPDTQFTFAARLARDNGWTDEFTQKAIGEYLRFLYLAARAGHPVAPSDQVDQVWHLHLIFTRHYWDVLCQETLGFLLHHEPTCGGDDEAAKFRDWYGQTLASYTSHFGVPAPDDVWPAVADRFSISSRSTQLALPGPTKGPTPRRWLWVPLTVATAGIGNAMFPQGTAAPILISIAIFMYFGIGLAVAYQKRKDDGKGNSAWGWLSGGGCSGDGGCSGGCGGCGG